jgi:hypothetical protein
MSIMGVKSSADIDTPPKKLKDLIVDHVSRISDEVERTAPAWTCSH